MAMNFAMLYGLIPIKGCEGPPGKTGERGPAGPQGENGVAGKQFQFLSFCLCS